MVKNPPANAGDTGYMSLIPGWENPLEEEMATHASVLVWRIPWTEEPVGYSPWGPKELDMTECTHTHTHTHAQPLPLATRKHIG